jgi:hypothetical protein
VLVVFLDHSCTSSYARSKPSVVEERSGFEFSGVVIVRSRIQRLHPFLP